MFKNLLHEAPDWRRDPKAAITVFLVALPLCLGIALASGVPMLSGILAGLVGALIVAPLSGSQLSVSGPAAGLTVIVLDAQQTLGSFESFSLAVLLAGAVQLILGFVKAGLIAFYFPSAVIKGMLAGIGLMLFFKQLPHAVGYDLIAMGDEDFVDAGSQNTFSELAIAFSRFSPGAIAVSAISLALLFLWDLPKIKSSKLAQNLPAGVIVVFVGISLDSLFQFALPAWALSADHKVNLPAFLSRQDPLLLTHPDFSQILNPKIWQTAFTIGLVASIETLLSTEAADKLDPWKRLTPPNRELKAQGIGNMVSGLIGGLPITSVIVRSSVNIQAGAKTKWSSFLHGVYLLILVLLIPNLLNRIPLAALAAILLMVGYKLASPSLFKSTYRAGLNQFLPFLATVIAVVFTDLLIGIGLGLIVSVFFILRNNFQHQYQIKKEFADTCYRYVITLSPAVSFLNKGSLLAMLESIPHDSEVEIDGRKTKHIDYDIREVITNYYLQCKGRNQPIMLYHIELTDASNHH